MTIDLSTHDQHTTDLMLRSIASRIAELLREVQELESIHAALRQTPMEPLAVPSVNGQGNGHVPLPPGRGGAMTLERRDKVLQYLADAGKPVRLRDLCKLFKIGTGGAIMSVVKYPWFTRTEDGYTLTAAGKRAAAGLGKGE